jgi:hypothetical protein
VRPDSVVVAAEGVELGLQIGEGAAAGCRVSHFFSGLVEALDLAAGLRVVGPAVAEQHAAGVQGDLEGSRSDAAP